MTPARQNAIHKYATSAGYNELVHRLTALIVGGTFTAEEILEAASLATEKSQVNSAFTRHPATRGSKLGGDGFLGDGTDRIPTLTNH